ncbi:MAG: hypothetical protein GX663_09965 [Clostridiales bacterium]|nr:hypothetical protein [Clostridiales bacterium]
MKRKTQSPSASIGIASLLVVFLILCLVTFAVLSLSSAKSNYEFSEKSANHRAEFYKASNESQEVLATISRTMAESTSGAENPESFCYIVGSNLEKEHPGTPVAVEAEGSIITASWSIPISKTQNLEVGVKLNRQGSSEGSLYKITKYQVVSTGDRNYNQSMDLIK